MLFKMLRAKLHHVTVTEADLHYVGSITLDADLLAASGLLPGESVLVADVENGSRHETYIIAGPAGSGICCVNGAAARLVAVGDRLIVMAFAYCGEAEARSLTPRVLVCDADNRAAPLTETPRTALPPRTARRSGPK